MVRHGSRVLKMIAIQKLNAIVVDWMRKKHGMHIQIRQELMNTFQYATTLKIVWSFSYGDCPNDVVSMSYIGAKTTKERN